MIDSKKIAKNTVFLYARLILIMVITIFSSRVILDKLGVIDYGLQSIVYSVIGMLSFLNATLSSGTSRFITFDLGLGNKEKLKTTFSTALYSHILLAGIIFIIGETVGLWYVNNVMICPPERLNAALIIYQISIAQTMVGIIQVPFTSEVMAHEQMGVYAYLSIYEAVFRLLVIYIMYITPSDKLITLSLMTFLLMVSVLILYIIYAHKKFEEVRFNKLFDRDSFMSILKFSSWNIIANLGNTLMKQGVVMLFNLFFTPIVVAAHSISNALSQALMQFVNSVRQAINPQVIKSYAEQNYVDSKRLTLQSAEYVFDLLMLIGIPMILVMPNLVDFWLVNVPENAVIFSQLIVLENILENFNAAFYTPLVAANKIKKNTYASVVSCFLYFGILFILFKLGFGPIWARIMGILVVCIWSFLIKPYILWKDLHYTWGEMYHCIGRTFRNFVVVAILCCVICWIIPQTDIWRSLIVAVLSAIIVIVVSIIFMERKVKIKLFNYAFSRLYLRR